MSIINSSDKVYRKFERLMNMLKKIDPSIWSGRTDHLTNRSSFRYHQVIEAVDIKDLDTSPNSCVLVGFECEEGVRRNKGRLGAATAPHALRKEMASLPWKLPADKKIMDLGNIACVGKQLEQAQQQLGDTIAEVLGKNMYPIILGGGHETAYGHYLGAREHIGEQAKLGIINIDAHFDMRSYEEQPSSGTMFRQILEQDQNANYFVVGIQRYGNTQELFDKADELGARYEYEENMQAGQLENLTERLQNFIEENDYIMLTLCTDVLNAAFAPGVSAPSPFGLEPTVVRTIIRTVTAHEKTHSFDISEVNPSLDENNRTVKLGAYLVNEAIMSMLGGNG